VNSKTITLRICIALVAVGTLFMAIAALVTTLFGAVAAAATRTVSLEAGACVGFAMLFVWSFGLRLAKASLDLYFETKKNKESTDA
jgi:hypothetical protein